MMAQRVEVARTIIRFLVRRYGRPHGPRVASGSNAPERGQA